MRLDIPGKVIWFIKIDGMLKKKFYNKLADNPMFFPYSWTHRISWRTASIALRRQDALLS
jgi:hypothetical protein